MTVSLRIISAILPASREGTLSSYQKVIFYITPIDQQFGQPLAGNFWIYMVSDCITIQDILTNTGWFLRSTNNLLDIAILCRTTTL